MSGLVRHARPVRPPRPTYRARLGYAAARNRAARARYRREFAALAGRILAAWTPMVNAVESAAASFRALAAAVEAVSSGWREPEEGS